MIGHRIDSNITIHTIAERLVTVQIHHATVLVANTQNHSLHSCNRVNIEVFPVQLNAIGRI